MGYCMSQRATEFFIPKDKLDDCLAAIKLLSGQETIKDGSGGHFSWVDNNFSKARTVFDALDAWRWKVEIDENGNISNITFTGEKLGDDEILFAAIAPFVQAGSYITMQGEDGCVWKWVFDGKTMVEKTGRVVFD